MSDTQALVERWAQYYNDDATRMVEECYAEDCKVYPMGLGVIEGRKGLQKVEDAVLAKAPQRRLQVLRTHIVGDTACVECELRDAARGAEWSVPFVAVLTIRDGVVVTDRTYADWSRWPGL
ncbi:MAG: nuclear transport factor 2 family protein [Gammaproteobacteria bacterium]|nr:nuclear transport factor 2 family protein [Gammaproteobacteria bacterium]